MESEDLIAKISPTQCESSKDTREVVSDEEFKKIVLDMASDRQYCKGLGLGSVYYDLKPKHFDIIRKDLEANYFIFKEN